MKKLQWVCSAALLGAATFGLTTSGCAQTASPVQSAAQSPAALPVSLDRAQVIAQAQETSEAQIKALKLKKTPSRDWVNGVMWAGIAEFATVSNRPLEADAVRQMGEKVNWTPVTSIRTTSGPFHADDDAIGQAFLSDYARRHDATSLAPMQADMDALVEYLKAPEKQSQGRGKQSRLLWWWCDALFMAPPVMAHLSQLTGDLKYLNAMDKEWWKTSAQLYDPAEHLFFRDNRFVNKLDASGKKVFWSRGNGWVLGGLARVLTWMPRDYPTRPKYEQMFRDMAAKLLTLQGADGMWRTNLLDPSAFPQPESSGTAFFCYGMAWGINNGLLPRETYLPAATKAWAALMSHRRADALPGYVQRVGYAPDSVRADGTQRYATGGILLAATELVKLSDGPPAMSAAATNAAPMRAFGRYVPERMDDIAWENDRIAFRLYGPALEKHEKTGSGIDVWAKSTRRMVINDWYRGEDYHKNHGEGLDFYHVGQTRGCGGLGIWNGGQLAVSRTWESYKILRAGPDSAQFELTYAPWDAGDRKIWETRIITLEAGSNLNRIESTLHSDKPDEITVGIGIAKTKDDLPTQDAARGLLASWAAPTPDGIIGCGVLVDPKSVTGFAEDELNRLILVRAMPEKPFVYYAGAGWDKSGDFAKQSDWLDYLKAFKR